MTPYPEVCQRLAAAGVRHVIVGAFAVDLYARDAGFVVTTQDCDILLPADPAAVTAAAQVLRSLGYELDTGGEPLPDEDPVVIAGIVRARACIRGVRQEARVDLPLEIRGATFEELWSRRRTFEIDGVRMSVGPLDLLLRSKELADRPKDRLFLAVHKDAIAQLLAAEAARAAKTKDPP